MSVGDPIILTGDTAARSRFGTSVTRIGDVNDDGYEGELGSRRGKETEEGGRMRARKERK